MNPWLPGLALYALLTGALAESDPPPSRENLPTGFYASYRRSLVVDQRNTVLYTAPGQPARPCPARQLLRPGDQLETGTNSSANIEFDVPESRLHLFPVSVLRILRREQTNLAEAHLSRGQAYFWAAHPPGVQTMSTPSLAVHHSQTEFLIEATATWSAVTVLDGEVTVSNVLGAQLVRTGERAEATANEAPRLVASILAQNLIQWWLDYPAVLDPDDLWPSDDVPSAWSDSIARYRLGDLVGAWTRLPNAPPPRLSPAEAAYAAGLHFALGQRQVAEALLEGLPAEHVGRRTLERLHRSVWGEGLDVLEPPEATATASEWLAHSYELQAVHHLGPALAAARHAANQAPRFGAAWVRVAELEFSHGRTREARLALDRALAFSPQNAAGLTLLGFLHLANNRVREAQAVFSSAIETDPNHALARLGRGLAAMRLGRTQEGRSDLITAVMLEPGRALLRAYVGKALTDAGNPPGAYQELRRAHELDAGDPTSWLYAALLNHQANRVNHAIHDLERSVERNDQRRLYRSRLLLDQDRAVRGVNLAHLYADVGLSDFGVQTAARAVNADYANPAAHLFLANSYEALRDPRQIHLRYETPWLAEYWLANLLAPVGAGALSPTVSQNEYSKLFERDGLRLANRTLWTSNGDWHQQTAQSGQFGDFEYSLDALYRSENGQRPNNDLEQLAFSATAKVQASPADQLLLQATWYDAASGDVLQRYDPADANLGLRLEEQLEPALGLGWQHAWQPGAHTLLLVAPWNNRFAYRNPANAIPFLARDQVGEVMIFDASAPVPLLEFASRYTGCSAELQQIWQSGPQTFIGGVRYQTGDFDTTATTDPSGLPGTASDPDGTRRYRTDPRLERFAVYAYDHWQVAEPLLLTAGVSCERLTQPVNFRTPPLTDDIQTEDLLAPKLGLTLTPWREGVWRAFYARSLSGVSFDQSHRLEPAQLAGFTQTYRGLIPESLAGSVAGQEYDLWGFGFDQTFPTRTYLTASAEWLGSEASRTIGAYELVPAMDDGYRLGETSLHQDFDYRENTLAVSAGQLIGRDFAFSTRYRRSRAELEAAYPEIPEGFPGQATRQRATLHQLEVALRFNHPSGLFATWQSTWNQQSNELDAASHSGDDFWQHDLWAGCRFLRRRAELAVGVLNLTDQDYGLYPLNYYRETYRQRTFAVSARFAF